MSKYSKELIKEAEAEILDPRHSFDMVIPGEVRINPNLSWEEKIFYSLIRNLCRREGYCWATNDYLRKEMNVCERTIKNWVSSLVKENLIEREIVFYQMKKRRRIWLKALEFKKVIIGKIDSPPSGNAVPHGRESGCPYTEESITEEKDCLLSGDADSQKISSIDEKKTKPLPSEESMKDLKVATNYFRDGTIIQTKLDDIIRDAVRLRKKWTTEEIMQAFEILCDYKGLIGDSFLFIEGTIENIQSKKKSENISKRKGNKTCQKPGRKEYEKSKEKILEEDTKEQVLVKSNFFNNT